MAEAGAPTVTLPPFSKLPACAAKCGPLYDVNGGCVPPAFPEGPPDSYRDCFCAHDSLSGLRADPPTDVCAGSCDIASDDYAAIRKWFTEFCSSPSTPTSNPNDGDKDSTPAAKSDTSKGGGGGGSWVSGNWRWLVMLVVILVVLVVVWVGMCFWRRRYVRKRDRLNMMGVGATGAGSEHEPAAKDASGLGPTESDLAAVDPIPPTAASTSAAPAPPAGFIDQRHHPGGAGNLPSFNFDSSAVEKPHDFAAGPGYPLQQQQQPSFWQSQPQQQRFWPGGPPQPQRWPNH